MREIEWEVGEHLYAGVLVNPSLPIRLTFEFFPMERVNEATARGRIGDLSLENDVVKIPQNSSLENEATPYLTCLGTLIPGRSTQTSYDFELVFFSETEKTAYDNGKPLESLDFYSRLGFRDSFETRFKIIDESLSIAFFQWVAA